MSRSPTEAPRQWPTAIDLFCGCGGVTAGLRAARFKVVAALDNDPIACRTYRENHPSVRLINHDIRAVDPSIIARPLGHRSLDLLVVCSPCQPFSSHHRLERADDRIRLVLETVRLADKLCPKLILFENVAGLASYRFKDLRDELAAGLKELGYHLGSTTRLDAANFGVPQRRVRCIMLAQMGTPPPALPQRTVARLSDVRSAISDLLPLNSGQSDPSDKLHYARAHQAIALARLRHIPKDGGSRSSLPDELQLRCHIGRKGYPDVYGRMGWDSVAPTLTTGCTDLTRGRFGHPRDDRALTLREAARLQTFPDNYQFVGNGKQIATQIGNAVPIRFVQELAARIRVSLQ